MSTPHFVQRPSQRPTRGLSLSARGMPVAGSLADPHYFHWRFLTVITTQLTHDLQKLVRRELPRALPSVRSSIPSTLAHSHVPAAMRTYVVIRWKLNCVIIVYVPRRSDPIVLLPCLAAASLYISLACWVLQHHLTHPSICFASPNCPYF
jgi:hypothetical protein